MRLKRVYKDETGAIWLGTAKAVENAYCKLYSLCENDKTDLVPASANFSKFNSDRLYGLLIDYEYRWFKVLSEGTVLRTVTGLKKRGLYI